MCLGHVPSSFSVSETSWTSKCSGRSLPKEKEISHHALREKDCIDIQAVTGALPLISYTVVFCYGLCTVRSVSPSFSYLSVFQPTDDTSEPVTMETTTQENLSFNLSPLPFRLVSENFDLQKLKLERIHRRTETFPGVPLAVVFCSVKI